MAMNDAGRQGHAGDDAMQRQAKSCAAPSEMMPVMGVFLALGMVIVRVKRSSWL